MIHSPEKLNYWFVFYYFFSFALVSEGSKLLWISLHVATQHQASSSNVNRFSGCEFNVTGVTTITSSSPCGFGCKAEMSCQRGFVSPIEMLVAECRVNATFNDSLSCIPGEKFNLQSGI